MKTHEGVDVKIHVFFISALVGVEWSASCSDCCTPREIPWYALNKRLHVPQSWFGLCGEEKILVPELEF
jgi:hypothetical protein